MIGSFARKLLRFSFFLTTATFLGVTAVNLYQIAGSHTGRLFVERSQSEITAAIDRLVAKGSSRSLVEARLREELATAPRDWIVIESLQAIAHDAGYALPAPLVLEIEAAHDADYSLLQAGTDCVRCAWDPASCELSVAALCGVVWSISPFGDVTSLSLGALDYAAGNDIDQVDLALSAVGLGTTVSWLLSAGTATPAAMPIKAGAGVLKFAYLAGKVPAPIVRTLRKAAREGIDWVRLGTARSVDDLGTIFRKDAIEPIIVAAGSLEEIRAANGISKGIYLLDKAESVDELRKLAKVAGSARDRTAGLISMFGKSRVLRLGLRLADEVYWVATGLAGFIASIVGMFWSTLGSALVRILRRIERQTSRES
ncbi:hypothetical protein OEW28_17250 [Defluviimonas sp. WL0002]|uniref:Uncharacterized protein n=1 Tax=Albidovulum marisflavi TaxID=2984159 RepID=A0ABT2ZGW9_9RHOB|nr:hypothetical protein [Defluviimonas sp. WL0002]MCV2870364.1 hypothetical protein [Defluviimonas sp. WL0002]